MHKQFFKGFVTKGEEGKYRVLASTAAVDRQGDSIDQKGWDLANFKKNPVMPWAHDYSALPVAKATNVEVTERGLEAEFEFAPAEGNPMAQQVKTLYDEGYLNAVSVGFIPKTRKGNVITGAELLEISFVPVPANQEALRLAMKSIEGGETLVHPEVKEAFAFMLKSIEDMKQKGEVANQLSAEEKFEQKYENWKKFCDIISALWTVYFDENTAVEDFPKLLSETAALIQELADAGMDGEETEDEESEEEGDGKALVRAAIAPGIGKDFAEVMAKEGRTLSKKTLELINKAIESMKAASTVLEDLASSSESSDGKAADAVVVEKVEDGRISLSIEDVRQIRHALVANDKTNELSLSIVNAHLKAKGATK